MLCKICENSTSILAKSPVLNKYEVEYYSCSYCGFIQTESPYWLDEAYSSAIARSDIGLIGRNIKLSNFCSAFIPIFCSHGEPFLDYGGGNGMFVRLMRDNGFEFYWQDIHASNQFAEGFEALPGQRFTLLTAFEVFEHLPQPLEVIADMFNYSDTLIFTTRLLPRWNIKPNEWWYFTPDTGQHVSLYSRESLEMIAKKFNVQLSSNGISLHILSPHIVPAIPLKALSYPPFAITVSGILNIRRQSLLNRDYYKLTGRRLDQQ
jgi:hypothetical protein